MSRFLVYTSPARGHLFPMVPVLDALADRGHEVAVRTLASEVPWLRARGLDAAPIVPAIAAIDLDDHGGRTAPANLRRSTRAFARRAPLDAADLQRAIADVEPTAVVVDVNAWGAMAAAEASGVPWAAWSPYPLPLPSRDAPPFGPGLPPAAGPAGRWRDALLRPVVFGALERILLPPINDLRTGRGLPPVTGVRDLYERPAVLLSFTAEPFEYPRSDWPASVRLVGPSAWDPPVDVPAWVDTIDRPVVLVATSSEFQDDGRLVEVALAALADQDVQVVATVPTGEIRGAVPANARLERFVPHGPLLDRAVCAITHGGMGVTQKALVRGVPVCAVPFGRDQFEVARRIEVARAGTRLPARRLRPDRLRRAVHRAIARGDGAREIARAFAATGGAEAAADHLQGLTMAAV